MIVLHQKGKPVWVDPNTINQIHHALKGNGSLCVMENPDHNLAVDESPVEVASLVMNVEVVANDD